jgi:GTP-binding protein SAR1
MFAIFNSLTQGILDVVRMFGFARRKAKFIFLGLDIAGKSTLLNMLKSDKLATVSPTWYAHSEELVIGNVNVKAFDIGGHETARRIWRDYFYDVDGILFIVDAVDRSRFAEARDELQQLLEAEALGCARIAVLGNKIDVPSAASEAELREALGLTWYPQCEDRVQLFMVSIVRRMGYKDAFAWMLNAVQ